MNEPEKNIHTLLPESNLTSQFESEKDSTPYSPYPQPEPRENMDSSPGVRHNIRFDEDGNIMTKNYLAAELPEITVTIHTKRTTYRFNGSYDGTHSLPVKLLNHMANNQEVDE